ncbi:MAG TPA: Gfo/Idh/MocA family oxidoreductase, partial [Actinomycetota bacterium]
MTDPVGLGLVGVGMWGRRVAAAAIRTPGVRLASCFVRDPDARANAAAELGCRAASSLDGLLEDPPAVLVVTPNHAHLDTAAAAAERGKHVFVEEPIADTMEAAEASFSLPGAFAPGTWRSHRQTLPGGPMTQLGVHHADTLQAWLGPAVRVQGSTAHLAARVEIDDVS